MKRLLALLTVCGCLSAMPASAAAVNVQTAAANVSVASTTAVTIASSTSGNLLIALVWALSSSVPTLETDNLGQTWSTAYTQAFTGESVGVFYKENTASGVTTVTSHHALGESTTFVLEYSGMLTSGAFDKNSSKANNATTVWSSNATVTTTAANEVLLGFLGSGFDPNALTIDSPWTPVTCGDGSCPGGIFRNASAGDNMIVGERIVSATGTYTATGTMTSNGSDSIGSIATFKAVPGAPTRTLLGVGKLEVDDRRQ